MASVMAGASVAAALRNTSAHVHQRRDAHACTAGDAGGDGKSTRGVELESVEDLDERQIAAWMKQVAAVPGVGRKKR